MSRLAGTSLVVLVGALCAFTDVPGLTPIRDTITDEPVDIGVCSQWSEDGRRHEKGEGCIFPDLESVQGHQGCLGHSPITLHGWRRSGGFDHGGSLFRAHHKLWFFNSDSNDPTPGGAEFPGGQHSTEAEREHSANGRWRQEYQYRQGSGELAARGIRAELILLGEATVDLTLVRTAPACATGACVSGAGLAKMVFETENLEVLAPELKRFFENRVVEEGLQEWYTPSSTSPETLRRKVRLSHIWCMETTESGWSAGVAFWPPGFSVGANGPDANGMMIQLAHAVTLDKRISICIRPPLVPILEGESAKFAIMLDPLGDTTTRLSRSIYSEVNAQVELKELRVKFKTGCVECDLPPGGTGVESTGTGFGVG